ncbi:hypothetical protein ACP70R_028925 [Stipagrostis hirtigluma subsp. patula]
MALARIDQFARHKITARGIKMHTEAMLESAVPALNLLHLSARG